MTPDYLFLTGATGHIGNYLLKDLLLRQQPVAVLVRDKRGRAGAERVAKLIDDWNLRLGLDLPAPVCLTGDTSQEDFGLSQTDRQWVKDHCRTLVHNAASVAFKSRNEGEIMSNNLTSAKRALEVCRDTNLEHLVFVSTAYVSGDRDQTIYEDELICGQSFRNEYEHSKYEAERTIRESSIPDQTTVIRPGIVVGHSASGHTNVYHTFYRFAQFTWALARTAKKDNDGRWQLNVRLAMSGNERRHVIPVDWVTQAMVAILENQECWGKTFHLTPSNPTTSRNIQLALQQYFAFDGVQFSGQDLLDSNNLVGEEILFYEFLKDYREYFSEEPVYDRANTDAVGFSFDEPEVDQDCMVRLIDYAVRSQFGRRRRGTVGAGSNGG
ncbi:Linear gramicidin synthase subunit D [Roseimaritima multifibrata]|uniref:Linear gramicidin synthase subunit D n=1 Tax=Roseimaritima multifibrata TaxID=1930274 RepID=A0A517ML56_9BACT|nr:SDR family oxidoreductase [Roseimaritima multifibrata]QDS95626.1 Linear gramicidin synthase subunit D [Roseimaritima multifibrata]